MGRLLTACSLIVLDCCVRSVSINDGEACTSTSWLLLPTDNFRFMRAACPPVMTMPLLDWAVKPDFSTLMSYTPGGNNRTWYSPRSSVWVPSRVVPVAALVMVSVGFGPPECVG